jgi:hypothetical protein
MNLKGKEKETNKPRLHKTNKRKEKKSKEGKGLRK